MKIFVSSTVFDLLDIRKEVNEAIKEMGFHPIMSESESDGFETSTSANSIDTCLVNVASSDEFILIIDKRYGPTLEKYQYPGISATHLEYNKALELKKPMHVFIRDRAMGDYESWKRNGKKDDHVPLWVKREDQKSLFGLIEAHTTDPQRPNWRRVFVTSFDLKRQISGIYKKKSLERSLQYEMRGNNFPLFKSDPKVNVGKESGSEVLLVWANFVNMSNAVAFDLRSTFTEWPNDCSVTTVNPWEDECVQPGASVSACIGFHMESLGRGKRMVRHRLSYSSITGIRVTEDHYISFSPHDGISFGSRMEKRVFKAGNPIEFNIEE
jgi:hypothetical protein